MNPRSSHTHCQVAQADTQAKTWQRVCLPHPEKIELKKFPFPSENKKYANAQPDTTKTETAKINNDKGLQTRKTRTPAPNRRLAQWRVTWLIEHSTSHQLLWCIDSFVLRNPPLRQAPNRYASL
ncbi:MAG: hypothetical protein OKBPIBMD_01846 [Chlorobi bacterium]|nr:hypothetical protein [Chlorobiota bacterium]WKZ77728.1 MAG: hypothetical protein QY319_11440 [Candidatus Kapabacteria bacterium]